MRKSIARIIALALLFGCKSNQLDFNKEMSLSPAIVVPIATLNMSLEDWAGEGIDADSSGALKVIYSDTSLIEPIVVGDYIDIPNGIGFDDFEFPLLNPEIAGFQLVDNTTLDEVSVTWTPSVRAALVAADGTNALFPAFIDEDGGEHVFPSPTNFNNGIVSTVTFELTLTNTWPVDLQNVVVTLESNTFTQATWTFTSVPAGSSATETFTLPGGSLDNNFKIDIVSMSSPGSTGNVAIDLTDDLDWNLEIKDIFCVQGVADMIPQTIIDSSTTLDLEFTNGEEVVVLELFEGALEYDLTSDMNRPTEIIIEFMGSTDANGDPYSAIIPINPNQNNTGSIDMSGVALRLDQDPAQPYNRLSLGFQFNVTTSDGSTVGIDTAQRISGTILFNGLEFEYIEGYFGAIQEDLGGTSIELDIDFLNQFEGSFQFNDPVIRLLTTNGVGAPIRTNFDMEGINEDGTSVALNMPPSDIAYPGLSQVGQNIEGVITIDKDNSNIVNFLANIPSTINVDGTVDINPDGNVGNNFIFRESLLKVGLEVDIGLNISASNLIIKDTINASFSIDEDSGLDPETVTLFLNVDNGIGLDAAITLIFEDENGVAMDSVQTQLLEAAQVDGDGFVISNTFRENVVELDEDQTDAFFSAERILLSTSLSTPQNGAQNYVMRTTDNMSIYLAIQSKVNILINEN